MFLAPNMVFANRNLIIFITYCVIVVTLTIPSFTLPAFLRYFKLIDYDNKLKQEALARVRSLEGITCELHLLAQQEKIPDELLHEFQNQIERRIKVIQTQLNETPYSTLNSEYQYVKKLAFAAIDSERTTLLKLRKSGEIHEEVFNMLLNELDLEEMRAKTLRL
jgi:NhaP-type Na+/H+ or K+/H+ antiporter